jgi:hypothetical protein
VQPPGKSSYYDPNLSPEEWRALARRNFLVLMAGQAALGLISPDVVGVAVEPGTDEVVLHVAVLRRTPELHEDLNDLVGDFEGLLYGSPEPWSKVTLKVYEGPPDAAWPGRSHALVFMAKV